MNCSDKFQQFLVGCERPCDPAAKTFLGARCSVRQWIHVLRQQGRLLEEFLGFLREWVHSAPKVNARPALLFSGVEVATLVVDPGSAYFLLVLLVKMHLAPCSGRLPSRRMEKCTQFMLRPTFFPWKSGHYFFEPFVLKYFQLCTVSASDFLGALDDEEFFVVEGSGVASLTPRGPATN